MTIRPVGAGLFHACDRQTDRQTDTHDKANSRFSNFANTPAKKALIRNERGRRKIYCGYSALSWIKHCTVSSLHGIW